MTILVVEDSDIDRKTIVETINRWSAQNNADITVYALESIDSTDITKYKNVDAALLDIEVPGIDGYSFAEYVRELNSRMDIAFISSHTEYRIRSHKIHSSGFLVKPVSQKAIIELIEFLYKRNLTRLNIKETITFKRYSTYITFPINDILYIMQKPYTHKLCVVTVDGNFEFALNISKVGQQLPEGYFASPIKGYLVNVTKIRCLTSHELELFNGEKIRVSPKKYDSMVDALTQKANLVLL